jgi:hypothetical protein
MPDNRLIQIDKELHILDKEICGAVQWENREINSPLGGGLQSPTSYMKYLRQERSRLQAERKRLLAV